MPEQEERWAILLEQDNLRYASSKMPDTGLPVGIWNGEHGMSVEPTTRVWTQSSKRNAPLLLLLALADWADEFGYCHPSLEQMAIKCRQTERNILNLIGELEKVDELRRVARGKGGRGKFSGSVYQVIAGMNAEEISASEQASPLARSTVEKLESREMGLPASRKGKSETDEKISGEKFSPEKQERDFSPVSLLRLNELINVSDSTASPPAETNSNVFPEERAEGLYRLVRPTHVTLPNSDQRAVALKVLASYLQRFPSPEAAAEALKPFAAEADARGIRQTNLCWLSEWAAVGQIPKPRKKWQKVSKPKDEPAEQVDYDLLRKRMEAELAPHMQKVSGSAG